MLRILKVFSFVLMAGTFGFASYYAVYTLLFGESPPVLLSVVKSLERQPEKLVESTFAERERELLARARPQIDPETGDVLARFVTPVRCAGTNECTVTVFPTRKSGLPGYGYGCHYVKTNGIGEAEYPLTSERAFERGSSILAAAAGTVVEVRDGRSDTDGSADGEDELGNYIVIAHADGIRTTYAHLKEDSLLVDQGETVGQFDVIAKIGKSGGTSVAKLFYRIEGEGKVASTLQPLTRSGLCRE